MVPAWANNTDVPIQNLRSRHAEEKLDQHSEDHEEAHRSRSTSQERRVSDKEGCDELSSRLIASVNKRRIENILLHYERRAGFMTIEKKSLISSLKTTKKANVAASAPAKNEGVSTRKIVKLTKVHKARMRQAF